MKHKFTKYQIGIIGGMFNRATLDTHGSYEMSIINQVVSAGTGALELILEFCDTLLDKRIGPRKRMEYWVDTVSEEFRTDDKDLMNILRFMRKYAQEEYDFKIKNPNWEELDEYQDP